MAEFNSKDTAAFKGVWVFCEQREGVIMSTSYQLLSEGRKLANDLGVELAGVVLGSGVKEEYLKALGGYGADKVYYCDHELLGTYTTDAYTKVICELVEDKKPEIFLIGATNIGRDLGPRCAARLHTGLTADCTHLDVDVAKYKEFLKTTSTIDVDNTVFEENTNLKMTRPAFGGHLMATIIFLISVRERPKSFGRSPCLCFVRYLLALRLRMASMSMGVTLKRSPAMP